MVPLDGILESQQQAELSELLRLVLTRSLDQFSVLVMDTAPMVYISDPSQSMLCFRLRLMVHAPLSPLL